MMLIRPVRMQDLDALVELAAKTGGGITSFQSDRSQLSARIERSERTFAGQAPLPQQGYLFVLEHGPSGRIVGVSGIEVAVGLAEPWYSFRISYSNRISAQLGIARFQRELTLCNDHAGYSELCTLFLDPEWRHSRNGHLLSKARFLFLAAFKERFASKIVAEMRGVQDQQGRSPLWESIGRHFCEIDFDRADYLTGIGKKEFIADLMPRGPIYTAMLPESAQAVLGKVHHQTVAAKAILEGEGFRHEGYVDIFDGGATLEAYVEDLRMVRTSALLQTCSTPIHGAQEALALISNEQSQQFRVILASTTWDADQVYLSGEQIAALGLNATAPVRIATVYPPAEMNRSERDKGDWRFSRADEHIQLRATTQAAVEINHPHHRFKFVA